MWTSKEKCDTLVAKSKLPLHNELRSVLKSHLLAPRSEPATSVANFVLRHSGLERGRMSKDILPFPLSLCPTAAELSLSLEAGRAQLGQAEEEEATVQQLLGHGQHLSIFTLCWIQALSTVLCHDEFICGVAPARLFACDEIKKCVS